MQETQHDGNINDCQFDFYGLYLASCDSNGFVQISSANKDASKNAIEASSYFKAHEGPVWSLAWAHPKYENVIATCGFDRYVRIWKEHSGQWHKVFEVELFSSVNVVAWAPWEYGLILAAGTTEGKIFAVEHVKDNWTEPRLVGEHA
jgi:protein transport protein SEC13